MGLTFWSDRIFEIDEATDALYHCALPLTDISDITSGMVTNAFTGISKMYGGGDSPEDVLLGKKISQKCLFLYVIQKIYYGRIYYCIYRSL